MLLVVRGQQLTRGRSIGDIGSNGGICMGVPAINSSTRPTVLSLLGILMTRLGEVRFALMKGRRQREPSSQKSADIVAKVFLGWRTKILRAADALYARQREGPYRFIQNRSRTSAVALKSDAAAEKSKDQLSRDFPGRSIFDFCNSSRSAFAAISSHSQKRA